MHELLLTSEILVGGCLLILISVLLIVFVRRRLIARGTPLTVCSLREPADDRWRLGLVRFGSNGLEWFRLFGISLRPARRWDRAQLDIRAGEPFEHGERPEVLSAGSIRVECWCRGERFEIALARAPYTALRSWIEASPPGRNVNMAQ